MTPLGQGILTGMTEVDDQVIRCAMSRMLATADRGEVNQTVLDLSALVIALAGELATSSNLSRSDVLGCAFNR